MGVHACVAGWMGLTWSVGKVLLCLSVGQPQTRIYGGARPSVHCKTPNAKQHPELKGHFSNEELRRPFGTCLITHFVVKLIAQPPAVAAQIMESWNMSVVSHVCSKR